MLKRASRYVIKMNVFTSDYKYFHLEKAICEKSNLLKYGCEEFQEQVFPLPNISSKVLNKIIHYTTEDVSIEESQEDLFELAVAADYLQMDEILDEICKKIAQLLKGKSPKEIQSILGTELQ